ncbi:hypothetical protein JTB14_022435 [Gonioctena quinquepunctata]|nr:hypothetical protein JTB14_022435 [Gonioctena quinquepunctata]
MSWAECKNIIGNESASEITPNQKERAWLDIEDKFNSFKRRRSVAQLESKYSNLIVCKKVCWKCLEVHIA